MKDINNLNALIRETKLRREAEARRGIDEMYHYYSEVLIILEDYKKLKNPIKEDK